MARKINPKRKGRTKFTDPRDGKQYKTVKIGEQVWMAENLNWEGAGCQYNNSPIFGNAFGRLYKWDEAMKAAPPGWHLPTDEEWQKLVDFAGGTDVASNKLRAKDGWQGNGTDDFGFSALPGGCRNRNGDFNYIGDNGHWWSATEKGSEVAYRRLMGSGDAEVYRDGRYKAHSFSVRLVKD
jgi:uncharacterized protein (TIGR02145 family)